MLKAQILCHTIYWKGTSRGTKTIGQWCGTERGWCKDGLYCHDDVNQSLHHKCVASIDPETCTENESRILKHDNFNGQDYVQCNKILK